MGTGSGRGAARRAWSAVVGCAVIALVLPAAAGAATITVGTNADDSAVNGNCTLREAITTANDDAAQDACVPGAGPDTIDFAGPGTITPTSALPSITAPVTLDARSGPGCSGTNQVQLTGTSAGPTADGLDLDGGNSTVCGFVIGSFGGAGVQVDSDNNTIRGNRIGIGLGATPSATPNGDGVLLNTTAQNNTVGGTDPIDRNFISGNTASGVQVEGGDSNAVIGNYLGTDLEGDAAIPNDFMGITVTTGSTDNVIGGDTPSEGNVISGNAIAGVYINQSSATGNRVEGNKIGTDATGTVAVANGQEGVRFLDGATGNVIGGDDAGEGNVISGNGSSGVWLNESSGNQVFGNLIGTNAAGTAAVPNGSSGIGHGVDIFGIPPNEADANQVGAPDTSTDGSGGGARNVISGNTGSGVRINGETSDSNTVEGNFIGTDITGTSAIPNATSGATPSLGGVHIATETSGNRIGGTAAGAENVISGNARKGVYVDLDTGANNTVEGNLIGTDRAGSNPLGNVESGVEIYSEGTTIGGTAAGAGNTIAHNGDDGVIVLGTGNRILGNSIFSNGSVAGDLGIDLDGDGVSANDGAGDSDTGPNGLQNFPVLTTAQTNSVDTTVQGTLSSHPTTTFRVEFFSNPACDAVGGNGEGKTFLGATDVVTDGAGNATISATLSPSTVGHDMTATATLSGTGDTSEFSACQDIAAKAEPPPPDPPPPDPDPGGGGGGGSGGGGGGGGGRPPADTRAPELDVGGDDAQDSKKKVKVEVSCDEACTVDGEGTIRVPEKYDDDGDVKSREKFDLRGADEIDLAAGDSEKLKLEFKNKAAELVEKAFKKKEKSTAKVTPTAFDAAGNETTGDKFEIKVKK